MEALPPNGDTAGATGLRTLSAQARDSLLQLCAQEQLAGSFADMAASHYWPLAQWLWQHCQHQGTRIIGINGGQGSGKSTLARLLARWSDDVGLLAVVLSIDDLYLSRARRAHLADTVHPLLATRGVPGTHDVALGIETLRRLCSADTTDATPIPRFDKATDEPLPKDTWPCLRGRPQLILLEGWCVGAPPQDDTVLVSPINRLEREADADGHWRRFVNTQLREVYPDLFGWLNALVMLRVPDMDCVFRWRREAEEKLAGNLQGIRASHAETYLGEEGRRTEVPGEKGPQARTSPGLMDATALEWFIMHYERLTRHQLDVLPARADWVFQLNRAHGIDHVRRPAS